MSDRIKAMLADREKAARAHEAGLRRELNRRIVEAARAKFAAAFERQQRYERVRASATLPPLPIETEAVCEAVYLAQDPGWDADRADPPAGGGRGRGRSRAPPWAIGPS